ncbi:TRAP transporter small permease [Celeribacter indicus]|nr:TRAP transporter small permease [Celeribacter indicus]SDX18329.1 TRAP-type C4-dicarboxylate transport system, small permease component [Celeribacter indicus]
MIAKFERFVMGLSRIATFIGAIVVVLMMVHVTADVVSKFVFSRPLPGTTALVSNYYMVVVTFLCLCVVEARNGHIDVELVAEHFPQRVQRMLTALALVIGLVVFVAFTWKTFSVANDKLSVGAFETEQRVKIITWPSYYIVPVGTGLMALMILSKLLGRRFDLKRESLAESYERANEVATSEENREAQEK